MICSKCRAPADLLTWGQCPKCLPIGRGHPLSQTEKKFQAQVITHARAKGWLVAHFGAAQVRPGKHITPVVGDAAGFPDLVMVRDQTIFVELKTDAGQLGPLQKKWLNRLKAAGAVVYVWRPKNWATLTKVLE